MANVKNNASTQETRRKLMEAAGQVFAQKGLHATLIRDITDRAGVNVAAVNYHFRDKFELYSTVLRQIHDEAMAATDPPEMSGPPAARLRAHVYALMRYMLDPDRPAWHAALFARELTDPTPALDEIIKRGSRERITAMGAIVGEILGEAADQRTVALATFSVLGQCLFYLRDKPLINRLYPRLARPENLDVLVDHVTRFSLAAMKEFRRAGAGKRDEVRKGEGGKLRKSSRPSRSGLPVK